MKKNKKSVNRWESEAFESHEIAEQIFFDLKKNLKYSPHPYSAWRSNPNQKLKTIQINRNGLRNRDLDLQGHNLENCMLLGGSVAWGFGASNNDNILSYQIEKILMEKYNKKINVINFAEQMHSSHEELMTFISHLDEIKPKIVICFSGTNDINRGWDNFFKCTNLSTVSINFFNKGSSLGIVNENNIIKFILKTITRFYKKFKRIENEDFFLINQTEMRYLFICLKIKLKLLIQSVIQKNFCYACIATRFNFEKE